MARSLHYFALEFQDGRLLKRHEFRCATDAEEGARIIATWAEGALAYQHWGDPELADWDTPEVLATFGAVPSEATEERFCAAA